MRAKTRNCVLIGVAVITLISAIFGTRGTFRFPSSPQAENGAFRNVIRREPFGVGKSALYAWQVATAKPSTTVPTDPIPVQKLSREQLLAAPDETVYRLGHSTLLIKLAGQFWLTDPVFCDRASPVQWSGAKRFHEPPISIADLPDIAGVILSHDHYDHLDEAAIVEMAPKVSRFITPLGVGDRLVEWGVDPGKIVQLDWWEETSEEGVRFIATPARHFSGRGLLDSDQTLWASWVILAGDLRIFFSGDTGYHAEFKTIGDKFGPFALTLMEAGAYDENWAEVHMLPEQTVAAHEDLRGEWMLPVHNGTFDLALHPWREPFDRLLALSQARGIRMTTPAMGEAVSMRKPHEGSRWWIELE